MKTPCSLASALALALALLAPSGDARAQAQRTFRANPAELLAQLDANGDLAIDRGEVPEAGLDAFETLLKHGDTNRDGRLDAEELRALLGRLRALAPPTDPAAEARRFRQLDRDGDGSLSRDEFTGPPALFDRLDADSDGRLSPEEIRRARPDREPPPPAPARPGDGTGSRGRLDV